MSEDIYVIVTEMPGFECDRTGFIYTTGIQYSLTLENAERQIKDIPKRFGKCRIAKLVFLENEK